MASNLYEILGLTQEATSDDIRKAYKKKALETHPDRFSGQPKAVMDSAEEEFRKVKNAYEVLRDSENRKAYDIKHGFGASESSMPRQNPSTDPFDMSKLFNSIFGPRTPFDTGMHGGNGEGFGARGGYGFRRESRVTTTINGMTHGTWTRVDLEGNEHVTRTYPDGRQVYTINGIKQGSQSAAPPPPQREMNSLNGLITGSQRLPSDRGSSSPV